MLQGISYSENDITKYLKRKLDSLMDTDSVSLSEAEQEVFAHIQSNARIGVRTTVKSLVDAFEKEAIRLESGYDPVHGCQTACSGEGHLQNG